MSVYAQRLGTVFATGRADLGFRNAEKGRERHVGYVRSRLRRSTQS